MTDLTRRDAHFEFGKNWADFSHSIDGRRVTAAIEGLRKLVPDLRGKSFLDIGCGSGLSSLAALRLGATRVFAADIDENSVATTKALLSGRNGNWAAERLSVFELNPDTHGTFDVVHSWGVLHHTGDMWRAIRHAATMVSPGGLFVIAIYAKTPLCGLWRIEKAIYSRSPRALQAVARATYLFAFSLAQLVRGTNPINYARDYHTRRGMRLSNDVHDWLGGYPYESARAEDIETFLSRLGFRETSSFRVAPWGLFGSGCSEFVYTKSN